MAAREEQPLLNPWQYLFLIRRFLFPGLIIRYILCYNDAVNYLIQVIVNLLIRFIIGSFNSVLISFKSKIDVSIFVIEYPRMIQLIFDQQPLILRNSVHLEKKLGSSI